MYRVRVTGNHTGDGGSVDEPEEGASPADGGYGGGISLSSSEATLTDVIVAGNGRGEDGILVAPGGAQDGHPATIGDGASLPGSGLHLSDSDVDLVYTTLAGNKNGSGLWVSGSARLTNTILVSHTVGLQVEVSSTARLEATLWGSGTWANGTDWNGPGVILTGTLNFWDEPGFLDPGAGDYHLGPASPALDRGVDARVLTDIDLQPRPYLAPDLGADEYWPPGVLERLYLPILMRACW
jgi:hypothetical protein